MTIDKVYKELKELGIKDIRKNELMKKHTTFRIGGPADIMILPSNEEEIIEVVSYCRKEDIDFMILGNGSNLLVKDKGIRGVVIKLNEDFAKISVDGTRIRAQSGALLTAISRKAMEHSLTGFEFANGIPGSIGGAITMNAGAYGGEIKDIVYKVRVLDRKNRILEYTNQEMNFRYRGSRIKDDDLIVLEAIIELEKGNFNTIKDKMKELTVKRTTKQPLNKASGGSTFKRPEGYYAAKLIEDSGLKGVKYGKAQVSDKHSGFIINTGDASCKEVLELIEIVKKTVRDKYNVSLEMEVKVIGED